MRKLILLTVLLLAVPAFADVVITCSPTGVISYDASAESSLVRAFALDIVITDANDPNITGVTEVNPDYYVYPGSIAIDGGGNVTGWGTPIAAANAPGVEANGITIELGSLYATGDPYGHTTAPNSIDVLGKLQLDGCGVVSISANTARGGVVLEDGTVADINSPGVTVPCCLFGSCFWKGDANNDGLITPSDVQILIAGWNGPYLPCADFNKDGLITPADVLALIDGWNNGCPP